MNNKNKNYFLIIIIVIIIILLFCYFIAKYYRYNEKFDNQSSVSFPRLEFQSGTSGISTTGTITFTNPFSKPPLIFTQVMPSMEGASNVYSVQLFNVTNKGFDYSKNKVTNILVNNENVNNMTAIKLNKAEIEPFNWIAFA